MWMMNRLMLEAAVPAEQPPASGGSQNAAAAVPAVEAADEDLFGEIATFDEMAATEPEIPDAALEPSGGSIAQPAEAAPAAAAVLPGSQTPPPDASPAAAATPTAPTVVEPPPTEQPTPASAAAPVTEPPATEPVSEPVDFEKHRAEILPKLEGLYKFSEEEAEELRVEPEKALPKLAARLHFEVMAAAFNSIMNAVPGMVGQTIQQQKAVADAEDRFYSKWSELKDPKYKTTVINSVKAYRTANPSASFDEVVERAGLMAMLSLGLTPKQAAALQPPPAPPPAPRPAAPAGVGMSGQPFPSASGPQNDFEALIDAQLKGLID